MPAFYQRPMANHMPLTPPDSGSGYGYSSMHYPQEPYGARQNMGQSRHDCSYDYQPSYSQAAAAQAPSTFSFPQTGYHPPTNLPPIQNYYEPIGAPILPPLRGQDPLSFSDDYQRRLQHEQHATAAREQQRQRQAAKEEKPTGGVSAKLDYDMERMTDFVTQATQSIFRHDMQSPTAFRKWVHQVLSATRLPSATILLSLHFLNDRVLKHAESVPSGETAIYRLLAVALILGSKFLDDNTFVNRSWADVTAIKVTELGLLEMKWLQLIDYNLHIDPQAPGGLQAWLDSWRDYDTKCTAKQFQAARLSPPQIDLFRNSSARDTYSAYPSPYSAAASNAYNTPTTTQASHFGPSHYTSTDPWAPVSQSTFDDFYKRARRFPTQTEIDDANRRASEERARQTAYAQQQAAYSYYNSPNYGSGWDQHAWSGAHRYDCGCTSCIYSYRPYPMTSSYSAQTVMG